MSVHVHTGSAIWVCPLHQHDTISSMQGVECWHAGAKQHPCVRAPICSVDFRAPMVGARDSLSCVGPGIGGRGGLGQAWEEALRPHPKPVSEVAWPQFELLGLLVSAPSLYNPLLWGGSSFTYTALDLALAGRPC